MPSRSKQFFISLLSGYGSIVVNVLFTMVSVPLALHYLGKEEFGLWALALQVNGYLALLDLGMSGAMSRFIADHKDDVNGGEYGSLLTTGALVFAVQGLVITSLGIGLSFLAPYLFAVPAHLSGAFSRVLLILAVVTGLPIMVRTLSAPLWAFQRMEVVNGCSSLGLLLRLALMWLGFKIGWGIDSLAWSLVPPSIIALTFYAWICRKNRYYPSRGHWGRPRWGIFKEVFAYGRDGLLMSIGNQLVNATQITIVSRILGLDAAATFSIATKLFTMAQQVFHKVVESAAPGLTELYIRGEKSRFVERYWDIIAVTLSAAMIGAVGITAGNSAFISLWTKGDIAPTLTTDLVLGLLIVITSISRCYTTIFGVTKNLRSVRILFFVEGLVFVPSAIIAAPLYGLVGVLVSSLFAHTSVTLWFSMRAGSKIIGNFRSARKVVLFITSLLALAFFTAWIGNATGMTPLARLLLSGIPILISTAAVWFTIIPKIIREQLTTKISACARRLKIPCVTIRAKHP